MQRPRNWSPSRRKRRSATPKRARWSQKRQPGFFAKTVSGVLEITADLQRMRDTDPTKRFANWVDLGPAAVDRESSVLTAANRLSVAVRRNLCSAMGRGFDALRHFLGRQPLLFRSGRQHVREARKVIRLLRDAAD
jgi:hypothetical protein